MEAALAAGAHLVNDISGLLHDPRSIEVVAKANCPVVLMHAPSSGDNPHAGAAYAHAVIDVYDWLEKRVEDAVAAGRSEEHTSELQSLMRISYAVFCLKKNNQKNVNIDETTLLIDTLTSYS